MQEKQQMSNINEGKLDLAKWVSVGIALFAAVITGVNAYFTYQTYRINAENQKSAIFTQFQNEYSSIASRFPEKILDKNFMPPKGSSDYKALQDYWIFCYAEWYQTKRPGQIAFQELWDNYYAGLITNALEIPSLRFVLKDMMKNYGLKQSSMREFYAELSRLATESGQPL